MTTTTKLGVDVPVPGFPDGMSTHVEVSVSYSKGGMNYFTYKQDPRGYYLVATPVEVKEGSKSFVVGATYGMRVFLKGAVKLSAKTLATLAEQVLPQATVIADALKVGDKKTAANAALAAVGEPLFN